MNIKPLRGKIIAEIIPTKEMTESGLYIVDKKTYPLKAKVLAVGANSEQKNGLPLKCPVAIGEVVYFKKYAPMVHNGEGSQANREGKITLWFEDVLAYEKG